MKTDRSIGRYSFILEYKLDLIKLICTTLDSDYRIIRYELPTTSRYEYLLSLIDRKNIKVEIDNILFDFTDNFRIFDRDKIVIELSDSEDRELREWIFKHIVPDHIKRERIIDRLLSNI